MSEHLTPARILIVDNDELLADFLKLDGAQNGHQYFFAHSGSQALAKLETDRRFDLIVIDYFLGSSNGLECALHIRSKWPELKAPLVILSGLPRDSLHAEQVVAKGFRFVQRPLDVTSLPGLFKHFLDEGARTAEKFA